MSNRKRPRGRPSKYPPEFQRDAVAMVLDEQRSIADVARSIGVNEGTDARARSIVPSGRTPIGAPRTSGTCLTNTIALTPGSPHTRDPGTFGPGIGGAARCKLMLSPFNGGGRWRSITG